MKKTLIAMLLVLAMALVVTPAMAGKGISGSGVITGAYSTSGVEGGSSSNATSAYASNTSYALTGYSTGRCGTIGGTITSSTSVGNATKNAGFCAEGGAFGVSGAFGIK